MVWHVVFVVALLAAGCDLYLRIGALRRERAYARTDDLTRLENRRAFFELAGREFERARRYGHPFTLAYFDIDDFREVSEQFPHQVGDEILRLVADAARRAVRGTDVLARLGADQFAVLLPEAGPDAASAVVKKLQHALHEVCASTALPLTVSGGVVTCLQPAESLEASISAADRLLYGAKAAGRDTFWTEVIAPQPLEGFVPARLRRANRLPPGFDVPMPPPDESRRS